jgi:D-glycero-D-manno-heptose 1,7-bisphosphate phosphatase
VDERLNDQPGTVILDRDGTIVVERHYLSHPDQIQLIPRAAEGLRRLKRAGFRLVVVTNQSGIDRGYFDWARLQEIHARMGELLAAEGVVLDGIYVCPHTPDAHCECRKPRTALIKAAAAKFRFEPADAWVVGDKPCDIALGRGIGARTIFVRTGHGARYETEGDTAADYTVDDLLAACEVIAPTHSMSRA